MKKYYNVHTVWLFLILLTLSSYLFGHYHSSGILVVIVLVFTAIIKAVLIMREFMELRGVSLIWRLIMYGWLFVVCFGILVAFAIGNL